MKYYKGLNKNMCASWGNGMRFEIGEKYKIKGDIVPRRNGFHFCKKLEDVWDFYDLECNRFFEVIPGSIVIDLDDGKSVTNSITLVRELTEKDIDEYIKMNSDILAYNKYWDVRIEVAKRGLKLDILVNDGDYDVRAEVARQGYGLDILINDIDEDVRGAAREMLDKMKI